MPHATATDRPTLVYSRDRELKEASDKELLGPCATATRRPSTS